MDWDVYSLYFVVALIGYFCGAIPFGLVLGKVFKVGDIRQIGSGNIGATNALRTGNKSFAAAVLLGDAIKGMIAILLARALAHHIGGDEFPHAGLVAGIAALLGHIFPVWLKFRGGKGVATAAGVMLILHWPTALCLIAVWLITAKLSKTSSLGAIIATIHAPIYALATGAPQFTLPFAAISLLLLWTHRPNIQRLLNGEESKIKVKA